MSALTRLQSKDFVRAKLGELDAAKVKDLLLNLDINFTLRETQRDLSPLIGMKQFVKSSTITSNPATLPTDLLAVPDAIVKLQCGVTGGEKAFYRVSYTSPDCTITYTAVNAGTAGNAIQMVLDNDSVTGIVVEVDYITHWIIKVNYQLDDDGASLYTTQQIIDAVNAHPIASTLVVATGTNLTIKPATTVGHTENLTGGTTSTPAVYYTATEVSNEAYIDNQSNSYNVATLTQPQFTKVGTIINILPASINSSIITYKYMLPDLTADTDALTIPQDYEELFLHKLMQKTYETLGKQAETQSKILEYEQKKQNYEKSYIDSLMSKKSEKVRLETNSSGD